MPSEAQGGIFGPLSLPSSLVGPNPTRSLDGALYIAHQKVTGACLAQEWAGTLVRRRGRETEKLGPPRPDEQAGAGNLNRGPLFQGPSGL